MNACVIVGRVWPAFSVPGISFTGTICRSLNTVVVVANEPMPSVSKNAVTNPTAAWNQVGLTKPPRAMATKYTTRTMARPTNSSSLALAHKFIGIGLRQIDVRVLDLLGRLGEQLVDRRRAVGRHDPVG